MRKNLQFDSKRRSPASQGCFRLVFLILLAFVLQCRGAGHRQVLSIAHPETLSALPLQIVAQTSHQIHLQPYSDHTLAVAQFLRAESDVLFTGTTLGAHQASKGVQLWRTLVWGTASIIVRPDFLAAGKGIAALHRQKVALPFAGSPNDIQLRRLAQKAGIQPLIEYHPHAQAAALLLKNQLAAIVVPEPLASKLVLEQGLIRLAELAALEAGFLPAEAPAPMVSFFILRDLSSEKKAILPSFEKQLQQALLRLQGERTELVAEFAAPYQVSGDILHEALKYTRFELPQAREAERRTVAFLRFAGIQVPEEYFFIP